MRLAHYRLQRVDQPAQPFVQLIEKAQVSPKSLDGAV